jgi:hypothetical protein
MKIEQQAHLLLSEPSVAMGEQNKEAWRLFVFSIVVYALISIPSIYLLEIVLVSKKVCAKCGCEKYMLDRLSRATILEASIDSNHP